MLGAAVIRRLPRRADYAKRLIGPAEGRTRFGRPDSGWEGGDNGGPGGMAHAIWRRPQLHVAAAVGCRAGPSAMGMA